MSGKLAGVFPASYLQEGWYRSVRDHRSRDNVPLSWRLRGPLDRGALSDAIEALVARHETLRTAFDERDGSVVQLVHRNVPVELPFVDLAGQPDPETAVTDVVDDAARQAFQLTQAPLWRAVLARLREDEHVLALVVHHSMTDAWSGQVIERDLIRLYRERVCEGVSPLGELELQMGDLAAAELGRVDAVREAAWLKRLDPPVPLPVLPVDPRWRPGEPYTLLPRAWPTVEAEQASGLARLDDELGTGMAAVLQAAVATALLPHLETREVVLGVLVSGRADLGGVVGPLFDYLPVRISLADDPAFADLVVRVREAVRVGQQQRIPSGRLRQLLGDRPPFDVAFNYMPYTPARSTTVVAADGGRLEWQVRFASMAHIQPLVDTDESEGAHLSYVVRRDESGRLTGDLYANGLALPWARLGALGEAFHQVLVGAAQQPRRRVSELAPSWKEDDLCTTTT